VVVFCGGEAKRSEDVLVPPELSEVAVGLDVVLVGGVLLEKGKNIAGTTFPSGKPWMASLFSRSPPSWIGESAMSDPGKRVFSSFFSLIFFIYFFQGSNRPTAIFFFFFTLLLLPPPSSSLTRLIIPIFKPIELPLCSGERSLLPFNFFFLSFFSHFIYLFVCLKNINFS